LGACVPNPRSAGAAANPTDQCNPRASGRVWVGRTKRPFACGGVERPARGRDGLIASARRAREDAVARRLMTIPGVGPITATAIVALAPPAETFSKGRDFAAWLGLAPRQLSTGGKQKLGPITKMGERTLRRLIIIGCSAVVLHASKRGA